MEITPSKQKWKNSEQPSSSEISEGKRLFIRKGLYRDLEIIIKNTQLFGLTVSPRSKNAKTCPRFYLYYSSEIFNLGYENLACVDAPGKYLRLIIRPLGRGKNRVTLFSKKETTSFIPSDSKNWIHKYIEVPRDLNKVISVLEYIKKQYKIFYKLS